MSTRSLLDRLDAVQPVVARRDRYYRGAQSLRFMVDKVDGTVMGFKSNLARVAVQAVAERIRLQDVTATIGGVDASERARRLVQDCDFPMVLQSIVTDMLAVGSAYLIVWVDGSGRPVITGESAEQVAVERDPITRAVTSAVKRWEVKDANGVVTAEHVVLYGPKDIVHLTRDDKRGRLTFVGKVPNPLGVVPVVPLINVERIHDDVGASVVDDLAPLLDALNKLIVDMMTTSEAVARPKRWATGVSLEDDDDGFVADGGFTADGGVEPLDVEAVSDGAKIPFRDADDMWVTEQAEAKFGQLPGADMSGYRTAVDLVMQQIMAVTSLPAHMVGITTANPSTAEALRAAEVALSTNAEGRVRVINRPVEWAVRLLVAIDAGCSPDDVAVDVSWADTFTRSIAQEADAAMKLHAEGVATTDEARLMVGAEKEI
ncbi:phage portal protein [Corynebacterium phoceense]